jgi:hypothetical protein
MGECEIGFQGQNYVPQEFLGSCLDSFQIRKVEVEEQCLFACRFFEVFDGSLCFVLTSGTHVHFCIVRQESLMQRVNIIGFILKKIRTFTVSLPTPVLPNPNRQMVSLCFTFHIAVITYLL